MYCERQGFEFDVQLTQSQILSGVYDLLDSFRITKELGQIYQRFFDHLRTKFFEDIADDEKSFVLFAQLFEYKDSPYLNAENYEDVAAVDDVSTGLNALNDKMKALFMWQYLTEYACHLRLSEATRDECRKILLPTMSDFSKFIPEIWTTLKAGGEKESERRVYEYQNNCAKSLINMFHSIDTEELGM